MIVKAFELSKIKLAKNKIILLYGVNKGFKTEIITTLTNDKGSIHNYEEKEVLENKENFFNKIFSKSLFENEKTLIIKRATDKILKIIEDIINRDIDDISILLDADNLEKKSKLRSFFEKNRDFICIPVYPDNEQTLSRLSFNFFKEKKWIKYENENGEHIKNKLKGLEARVFQHEYDHMEGTDFTQKVSRLRLDMAKKKKSKNFKKSKIIQERMSL